MTGLTIDGTGRRISSAAFDYSALDDKIAAATKAATARIHRRVAGQIKSIMETGADLLHVKEMLAHGQFTEWLSAEFGMTDRTARNYMAAATSFEGKTETISVLPTATVYALAHAPDETRATIVERLEAGDRPSETEIKRVLSDVQFEKRQARIEAKFTAAQRKRRERTRHRLERESAAATARYEKARQRSDEAAQKAAKIIADAVGDGLPELLSLIEVAGFGASVLDRLRANVAADAGISR